MPELFKHNKTGDIYVLLSVGKNCTNAQDNEAMVRYIKPGLDMEFYREVKEFYAKFTKIEGV